MNKLTKVMLALLLGACGGTARDAAGPSAMQTTESAPPPRAADRPQAGRTAVPTAGSAVISASAGNAGNSAPSSSDTAATLSANAGATAAAVTAGSGGAVGSDSASAAGSGNPTGPAATAAVTDPALAPIGLGSVGVGVNDLDKAADFFVQMFGMKVNTPMIVRDDRTERVLNYDNNNTTLTLMKYNDGRMITGCYDVNNCSAKNVPGKLVFYATSPSATGQKVVAGGYKSVLNAGTIVQVSAIDDYLIEILQGDPAVIAIALAVTDFQKTNDFYSMAFGLSSTGTYNDPTMSGLQEAFYANSAGGAAVVVQHYTQGEWNYKDNPMKTVWLVDDAAATLMKVVSLGGSMVSPPTPLPAFNDKPTAIAKDADGYVIELVQK